MRLLISLCSLLFLLPNVTSHLQMSAPAPRRSKFSTAYQQAGTVDYDMSTPLGIYPCKGYPKGPVTATYAAGSNIAVSIDGSANHGGGHCQFALSYDNGNTFVVIHTIGDGECVKTAAPYTYQIPLPATTPSATSVTFAWTWINAIGNREFYMNCADISITGSTSTTLTGKELLVVNLPGKPVVAEFAGNPQTGMDLLNARRTITINAQGSITDTKPGDTTTTAPITTVAPTQNPPPAVDSGKCAKGAQCSSTIPCCDGTCCSKWGYCGTSPEYCGLGCQSKCDNTQINQGPVTQAPVIPVTTMEPPKCADTSLPNTKCSATNPCCNGQCCSQYGYCGSTFEYCGTGCQSKCNGIATPATPPPQEATPPPTTTSDKCGKSTCSATSPCCSGACCSKWGYCGTTTDYCGTGCVSNCPGMTTTTGAPVTPVGPVAPTAPKPGTSGNLFDFQYFNCVFRPSGVANIITEERATALHAGFVSGANKFKYSPANAIELAAFYGHVAHEADYLKTLTEYCAKPDTCADYQDFWCPAQPIPAGKKYYGRGWLQLTWPCNYIAAGNDPRVSGVGSARKDIFQNPDLVETDLDLAVQTALWFWDVNGISTYARGGQFAATTDKINGAVECRGGAGTNNQLQRIERYQQARICLGLPRETDQAKLSCASSTFSIRAVPLSVLLSNTTDAEWNYDANSDTFIQDVNGNTTPTPTPTPNGNGTPAPTGSKPGAASTIVVPVTMYLVIASILSLFL